jgi:hypothetical protein
MKVAIIQSNYIPWKGYFDLIGNADLCVFLDDVQFTKNDWRNRNQVKSNNDTLQWLTIPVGQSIHRLTSEVKLPENRWEERHLNLFKISYQDTPSFDIAYEILKSAFDLKFSYLSEINQFIIKIISKEIIGKKTEFIVDSELIEESRYLERTSRIKRILEVTGATNYLSGPRAKEYIEKSDLNDAKVKIEYANYDGYPIYKQHGKLFHHNVSILDLISWEGNNTSLYLKNEGLFS